MLKKLLPVLIVLIGLGGGIGAGLAAKKPAETDGQSDIACLSPDADLATQADIATLSAKASEPSDFIKMPNQFVVPVVDDERVVALVVMSLTLEIDGSREEAIFSRLPKLRDGFLRIILDHANIGGFDGKFTSNGSMDVLRRGFNEVARAEFADAIYDVLILDINRQDLS